MFVFILFGQEKVIKTVRSEMEEQRQLISRMEKRLVAMQKASQAGTAPSASAQASSVRVSTAPVGESSARPVSATHQANVTQQAMPSEHNATPKPIPSVDLTLGDMAPPLRSKPGALRSNSVKPVGAQADEMELFMAPPQR